MDGSRFSSNVGEVRMNPLGREGMKEGECRVAGAPRIWLPTRFLIFFFENLNCFNGHEASPPFRSSSS